MSIARKWLLSSLLAACGPAGADLPRVPDAPSGAPATAASGTDPGSVSKGWVIRIATDARESLVHVEMEVPRVDLGTWELPRSQGTVRALAAHDASGPIEVARDGDRSFELRMTRAIAPPLALSYDVVPADPDKASFPLEITPDRAAFSGAAVLISPTGHGRDAIDLRVTLIPAKDFHARAAWSLGPELDTSARLSFEELSSATFVFGATGFARFSAPEGRDHSAWLGFFSFDPRWASAEAAGVRTMADRWLGVTRSPEDPSVGLVFVPTRGHTRELSIRPALRGALVEADVSAPWSARARIDITRLFVQRTIGPTISLRAEGCAEAAASLWFDEGVAHAVALDVLREAGILSNDEIISEVNSWLGEEALSPHGKRPLESLCGLAISGKEDGGPARRLLAVRGALVGLALSDLSADVLRPSMRDLLELAKASGRPDHPLAALFDSATKRGAKAAPKLREALTSGAEIALAQKSLGPCADLGKRTVHPFELGFTVSEKDGGGTVVRDVVPQSSAAKAGVKAGDTIVSVDYAPGWTSVPVRLQVQRGTAPATKLEFLPQGPGKPGRAFTAVRTGVCAD